MCCSDMGGLLGRCGGGGCMGGGRGYGSKRLAVGFTVGQTVGGLGLYFLVLALIHGLSVFWALHLFSWAIPYFASLDGHLLASAG